MRRSVAEMIVRDPEKYAHHDRVFLNNPVVMQGMGLAPLVVLATTGKNALMLAVSVALLLTPSRMLACLLSRAFPLRDEQPAKEELEKKLLPRGLIYSGSAAVVYLAVYPILNALFGVDLLALGIYLPMLVVEPLLIYRFGRVQETMQKAVSKGLRITLGYVLLLWPCITRRRRTASMSEVLRAVGIFCSYAVLAVFAQSAVFTRGLGVSRLVQLVGDDRTNSWWFALLLCVTQLLVAPLAFYAGQLIAPLANRAQLRPVVYVACVAVVCIFAHLVLRAVKGPRSGQLLRILPVAAINSCVLGTVLVERTQSFTLGQSLGFGLGSGLGYLLAVLLVTEARHRLRSRAIPSAFRGLPVTLVYIGVLALAIYGFTGHSVIL